MGGKLSLYKTNWINTEARSYFRQKDIRDIFFHESARIRTNAGRALFASIRKEWIILLHAPLSLFISHRFHRSCDTLPRWFLLTDFTDFHRCITLLSGDLTNARICGDLWDLCDTLPRWFLLTDFTDLHRCVTLLSGDLANARTCGDLWERFNAPSMKALRR